MPCVRVWDMEDPSHPQIAEMTKGHKFGVACVVSLNSKCIWLRLKLLLMYVPEKLKCRKKTNKQTKLFEEGKVENSELQI